MRTTIFSLFSLAVLSRASPLSFGGRVAETCDADNVGQPCETAVQATQNGGKITVWVDGNCDKTKPTELIPQVSKSSQ